MEEANQPQVPSEPSEEELRAMLEEREKKKAGDWSQLKRWSTWIVVVFIATVAGIFFGSGLHKDLAAAMAGESPLAFAGKPQPEPAPPASAAGPAESVEAVLRQSSGYDPATAKAKPGNGKIIDQDDIRFTMQLMHFMQGPTTPEPRPAADAKPKDGK